MTDMELNFGTPVPKAEPGTYPALLVGVEPFVINEGTADAKTLIRWEFSLDGTEDPETPGQTIILDVFPRDEQSRYFADITRTVVKGPAAETVRKMAPEALMIFITTESEDELVHRLETRKTETADSLAIRIATARKELKRVAAFDYVIINRDFHLDETVDAIRAIITAEHHRVSPRKVSL